jgi:hypothetical protein
MKDIASSERKIPIEDINLCLLRDPGIPTVPCSINNKCVRYSILELGVGVNVMPFFI